MVINRRRFLGAGLVSAALACIGIGVNSSEEKPDDKRRSSRWPATRKAYLETHPACRACGGKKQIAVHHKLPFDAPGGRALELDHKNLITLCEDGPFHLDCHAIFGHAGNYRDYNPHVEEDADRQLSRFKNRIKG